jgi:hypothetical protein
MSTVGAQAPDSEAYFGRAEVAAALRAAALAIPDAEAREVYSAIAEEVISDQVEAHRACRSIWCGDLQPGLTPDHLGRVIRRVIVTGIPASHEAGEYPGRCDAPCAECRDLRSLRNAVISAMAGTTASPALRDRRATAHMCARPTCGVIIPGSKPNARYCSGACLGLGRSRPWPRIITWKVYPRCPGRRPRHG